MKKDELTIIGLIYVLIIVSSMYFIQVHKTNKEFDEKIYAMSVALQLNDSNDQYIEMLQSMNDYADQLEGELQEYKDLDKLKKDLRLDKQ